MISSKLITKVLLIDDDETIFSLLKTRLSKERVFLIWAKDGEEGIKKAKIEMPDLIITDVVMPKINGFEVIKELKGKPLTSEIDFIILSNFGEPRMVYDEKFLLSLGIRRYLIKSNYSPTELVTEIRKTLSTCLQKT